MNVSLNLRQGIKNVVASKIGSGRSLDTQKLSNVMGNAALTHANKARARIMSAKATKPISLSVPMRLKLALRNVFIHYSNWPNEGGLSIQMSRTQFLRCCRDCRLMRPELTAVQLNILFEKVHQHSTAQSSGSRLSISDWITALGLIANRLYGMLPQQAAFETIVQDHVLRFAPEAAGTSREDRLAAVMLSQEVVSYLHDAESLLFPIFEFYCKEQEFSAETNWKDVERAKTRMPFDAVRQLIIHIPIKSFPYSYPSPPMAQFLRFAHDFDLTPKILGKAQLSEAFKCARFGHYEALQAPPGSHAAQSGIDNTRTSLNGSMISVGAEERMIEDAQRIGFEEFLEAVGRCALTLYYVEPVAAVPTLSFSDSYQPAAKKLWINQEEEMAFDDFPDEIMMPVAEFDAPSPRGMDDVISRAQSKVFTTRGSVRIVKIESQEEGGGGEVFQVHPEPEKLVVKNRPKHLSSFSPDWIGVASGRARGEGILLPPHDPRKDQLGGPQRRETLDSLASSLSPSAINRLQNAREGSIGAKLEKFASFAADTLAAREREKSDAAHQKLLAAAEHRAQLLQRAEDVREMRKDLQAYCGQRIVESEGRGQYYQRASKTLTKELQSIL